MNGIMKFFLAAVGILYGFLVPNAQASVRCEGLCLYGTDFNPHLNETLIEYGTNENLARSALDSSCSSRGQARYPHDLRDVSCQDMNPPPPLPPPPTVAGKWFQLENKTQQNIYASIAYFPGDKWRVKGWFLIAPGQKSGLWSAGDSTAVWFYASASPRDLNANTWVPTLDRMRFCVDANNAFEIVTNPPTCEGGGLRWADFGKVPLNPNSATTHQLNP